MSVEIRRRALNHLQDLSDRIHNELVRPLWRPDVVRQLAIEFIETVNEADPPINIKKVDTDAPQSQ